jgi:hypothetical protein
MYNVQENQFWYDDNFQMESDKVLDSKSQTVDIKITVVVSIISSSFF